ncbi:MAG: DUF885 domain-containing protein [Alphaproteobacteria bacterium]|nr:DUF885 domain-containing protein [Alphaproteobacteria bacterium]
MDPRLATFVALALAGAAPAAAEPVEAGGGTLSRTETPACHTDLVYLNQLFGWQVRWPREWASLAGSSDGEVRDAIARWRTAPAALAADTAALAATRPAGGRAPREVVERVLAQVRALEGSLGAGPPPLAATVDPALRVEWTRLFNEQIAPSVVAYRRFLAEAYLPGAARSPGLLATPDGPQCFRALVRSFTTADLASEEVEAIGWRLLRATEADMAKTNRLSVAELPAFLETLRHRQDPAFTAEVLTRTSQAAIARAAAAMPRIFRGPVRKPILVKPLPKAMEESFPAGLYQPATGTAPAAYVINLSRPMDRQLMAEVIAFHEGLPGHHASHALGYPFGTFNSGFLEGWGLYAEYVADELGLYSGPRDRTGMMAKHLWAASRLIVEPGLHVRGWSREQAVAFMRRHTALSEPEIALEVDRYIATPGQSLSYMIGYDRIRAARDYAQAKLGRRFDVRDFHDVVLRGGSRPLAAMYADVVRWADARARG